MRSQVAVVKLLRKDSSDAKVGYRYSLSGSLWICSNRFKLYFSGTTPPPHHSVFCDLSVPAEVIPNEMTEAVVMHQLQFISDGLSAQVKTVAS